MDNNTGEEQLTADFDESYQALVTAKDALLESYDPDDIDDAITLLNEVITSLVTTTKKMKSFPSGTFDFSSYRSVDCFIPYVRSRGNTKPILTVCGFLQDISTAMELLAAPPTVEADVTPNEEDLIPDAVDVPTDPRTTDASMVADVPTATAPPIIIPTTSSRKIRRSIVPTSSSTFPSDEILVENAVKCQRCSQRRKPTVCYLRVSKTRTTRCDRCRKTHQTCVYPSPSTLPTSPTPPVKRKAKADSPISGPSTSTVPFDPRPSKKSTVSSKSSLIGPPAPSSFTSLCPDSSFENQRLGQRLSTLESDLQNMNDRHAIEVAGWVAEVESLNALLDQFKRDVIHK